MVLKSVFNRTPWLILSIPFAILIYFYTLLPNEMLISRSFFGSENIIAPKSLLTVFRVPLIEIICASAIEVMRRKFRNLNSNFYSMWNTLLYTVSLKSLFQALEIVSSGNFANIFFYITIGIVVTGIIVAIYIGRNFFLTFSSADWSLNSSEKMILILLLISYLGFAIVPILAFK